MPAPLHPEEAARLKALRSYDILDTPPEETFDELARLAAQVCEVPSARVTFVDESRQWFKARVGIEGVETPREESICSHALLSPGLLVVPDTLKDPRFAEMPQVRGAPHIRFYAGAPLVVADGHALGALCVIDYRPRELSPGQQNALRVLAAQVVAHLELRRRAHEQARSEAALLGILEDQRFAEQALRKSESEQRELARRLDAERALLAEAQAIAKVGSWETDIVSGAVSWSQQIHRIFGTDPAKFSPSHQAFLEFVHPEDRAAVDAAFMRSFDHRDPCFLLHRLLLPDGTIKHVEERWQVFAGADGRPSRATGTCQDITERKRAEEAQLTLSQRLSDTIGSIADAFYTVDREWRFTYLNRESERMMGRMCDSLLGRQVWAEFPEAVGTTFDYQLHHAMEDRVVVQFEEFYPPFNQWLEVRCYPSAQGLAVYFRDVTARRQADAQLRLLENCISRISDIVIITRAAPVDEPGPVIVFVNDAFERVTGYTRAEAIGRSPRFLQGPKTSRQGLDRIRAAITAGRPVQEELVNYTKDGRECLLEINISPVSDPDGSVTHLVAVERDITERKKLEDQFLRAQRMESIGTLAGGIAHDLNNLLSPIIMGADLIGQFETRAETRLVLQNIQRSARRGAELVRQVLSFARGVEGARVPVHLGHVVNEVESIAANTFPKNIVFESRVPDSLRPVVGDPTQLNQVLLNLCVNARDAMPQGGRLTVSCIEVEVDTPYAVMNRGVAAGRYVVMEVADTGQGMTREVTDRIFEPFFTTKEVGSGTGLGLSTVLGIVRSHGGFVNVYSEPGQGSVFKIYLPALLADDAPDADHLDGHASLPRGDGELILLVDDETSILSITGQTLESFGYRTLTSVDGAQAIGVFAQHRGEIALVLTDMMMPVMDGPALITAVRRIDAQVPIVAASGLNSNSSVAKASAAGVRHFLSKPYNTESLLKTVKAALAGQRPA